MEAMRNSWTDERLDDLAGKVDGLTSRVDAGFDRMHDEFIAVRREDREMAKELRGEMNERFNRLDSRFDVILGAIVASFIGLVVTHFLS